MVYTMGMEHTLATSCPVFVRITLHDEWTCATRRPYDPVYISLPGPRMCLTRPSVLAYNTVIDSSIYITSDVAVVFFVCL